MKSICKTTSRALQGSPGLLQPSISNIFNSIDKRHFCGIINSSNNSSSLNSFKSGSNNQIISSPIFSRSISNISSSASKCNDRLVGAGFVRSIGSSYNSNSSNSSNSGMLGRSASQRSSLGRSNLVVRRSISCAVFMKGILSEVSIESLKEGLSVYGDVKSIHYISQEFKVNKTALIHFGSLGGAINCFEDLNKSFFLGSRVQVEYSSKIPFGPELKNLCRIHSTKSIGYWASNFGYPLAGRKTDGAKDSNGKFIKKPAGSPGGSPGGDAEVTSK